MNFCKIKKIKKVKKMKKKCENEQNLMKFTHFFKKNKIFDDFLIFPKIIFFHFMNLQKIKYTFSKKRKKKCDND